MEIREVTYLAVALRVMASVIIGGLIGLERGMKNCCFPARRRKACRLFAASYLRAIRGKRPSS